MGKRFTDTMKWTKKWFRSLSPDDKLAWGYLTDNCDAAGVIALDEELADFQIKKEINWERFIGISEGRVERLPNGRLWLTTFLEFQYPNGLSKETNAHKPIFDSLERNSLLSRVCLESADCRPTVLDKDKEKEPDKDSGKGNAKGKPKVDAASVPVPHGLDTPAARDAIAAWIDYKASRGEGYKDAAYLGRKVAEFSSDGPAAFVAAVNSSIGNNYAGLFRAKDRNGTKRDNSARSEGGGERGL